MQKSEKDENKNCAKNNQKGSIGLRLNSCTYCCCISREHVELVDQVDLFMMAGLRDWWNTWSNWKICKFIWKYLTNCKNIQKRLNLLNMINIQRSKKQDWLLSHEKYDGIFYEFLIMVKRFIILWDQRRGGPYHVFYQKEKMCIFWWCCTTHDKCQEQIKCQLNLKDMKSMG